MKRAAIATAAVAAVTIVLEIAYRHLAHGEFAWHAIPAFDLVYGFLSCGAIVVVSKSIGHAFLQRPEDYYDESSDGGGDLPADEAAP